MPFVCQCPNSKCRRVLIRKLAVLQLGPVALLDNAPSLSTRKALGAPTDASPNCWRARVVVAISDGSEPRARWRIRCHSRAPRANHDFGGCFHNSFSPTFILALECTTADGGGAGGGEYPTMHLKSRCTFCPVQLAPRKRKNVGA